MKHWILGAALFAATGVAQAEKLPYRAIAFAKKLDVWIDNIKGNTAQSWCANEVALRIVANGNKNVKILDNFPAARRRVNGASVFAFTAAELDAG